MWENDDACIKCGICVSACPVYAQDPEFPGPKALGPDWYRSFQESPDTPVMDHVTDCTFCQLCEASCPVHVPIAHLIAHHKHLEKKSARRALRDRILAHPQWVARLPQLAYAPAFLLRPLAFGATSRWPRPRKRLGRLEEPPRTPTESQRVGLFVDCYSRGFDQDVLSAAQALLEVWGYSVQLLPRASHCCGAAAYAAGQADTGQQIARDTSRALAAEVTGLSVLITLNATCDSTLRDEWPVYWDLHIPVPVVPFTEFALDCAPQTFWDIMAADGHAEAEQTFWVHTTCRSRVSRGDGMLAELAERAGLPDVQPLNLACCGAAGSYAFKREHEMTAHEMGRQVLDQVQGATDTIMVDSGTCGLHLSQLAGVESKHPAYWLYRRYQAVSERRSVHGTD